MDIIARLIELKPDSSHRVREWAEHIEAHREQALASLRSEGVSIESWFSLSLEGKDYLLCYMRADSLLKSQQIAADSVNPVDLYHQQFKVDTWVRGAGAIGKLLVDLSPPQEWQSGLVRHHGIGQRRGRSGGVFRTAVWRYVLFTWSSTHDCQHEHGLSRPLHRCSSVQEFCESSSDSKRKSDDASAAAIRVSCRRINHFA